MTSVCDVLVIFGGVSSENEISVITGTMACNVLKKAGKSVLPLYISPQGELLCGNELADISLYRQGGKIKAEKAAFARGCVLFLGRKGKVKGRTEVGAVLNCCHGGAEEGGSVAGLVAVMGVPFASAGMFESAAFMDKYLTKLVLKGLDAPVAPYIYADESTDIGELSSRLEYPVIVKPCRSGSSIGITRAEDEAQLRDALDTAFAIDSSVIIERCYSPIREINCAAYYAEGRVRVSDAEEVFTDGALLTFSDKYSGGGKRQFPARLTEELSHRIRALTERVYSALNMRGIVRFDYILYGDDLFISEINTVPGSLSQYLVSCGYRQFAAVLEGVLAAAEADFAARTGKRVLHTGILDNIPSNACKLK